MFLMPQTEFHNNYSGALHKTGQCQKRRSYGKTKLKIGVIAHLKHPIREPFAGGLEMHTYLLCKSLRQRRHQVTLFASAGSADELGLEPICGLDHSAIGPKTQFRQEHRIYFALMETLRDSDFDIIHNNSLHYLPLSLANSLPMPMVTVLHTPPFWEMEGSITQNNNLPNSSFVAVSSFLRDCWAPIARVQKIIRNGIDLETFSFTQNPADFPYIVWSGRIVPEKGLHLALLAARQAGLDLRIAGPIQDRGYFERDILPCLNEHARYVGHLNHADLAALIGGARAVLFTPLWDEPYGLVLAEALACGTPVASFARGAAAEILDKTCGIIVPPANTAALAQAAHEVQILSRFDCRRRAEYIADSSRMITQYENLYRQLIQQNKISPASVMSLSGAIPDIADPRTLLAHYMARLPAIASEIPLGLWP